MTEAFLPHIPAPTKNSAWKAARQWVAARMSSSLDTSRNTPLSIRPDVLAQSVRDHVPGLDTAQTQEHMHRLQQDLIGLGPLAKFARPGVSDILVDQTGAVWTDAGQGLENTHVKLEAEVVQELATRLLGQGGKRLDQGQPFGDVQLRGARIHAVIPPISLAPQLSIRMPASKHPGLQTLSTEWAHPDAWLTMLHHLMSRRCNLLISGATGSGKTTLLAALLATVTPDERILTVEDTPELDIDHPHVVGLKTREANTEGAGEVGMSLLIRQALRMRPDRVIVGECRGAEITDFLAAMNTGHRGAIGTLHANSVHDVPARLHAMAGLAGLDPFTLNLQARSALDAVIHLERDAHGRRQPVELGVLAPAERPDDPLRIHTAIKLSPHGLEEGPGLQALEQVVSPS